MATQAQDEDTLAQIGYKQELNRDWSMLHNFGISFSVIVCGLGIEVGVRFVQQCFFTSPLCNSDHAWHFSPLSSCHEKCLSRID